MSTTADQARQFGFAVSYGLRRKLSGLRSVFSPGLRFDGRAQQRLLIAPHDLRTADATIANDIYRGRLSLAGSVADIGTTSPFLLTPPSRAWQEELYSFAWLRHLHAADDAVSRVHARALISDWIAIQGRGHPVAWKPEVMARRVISWLAHSPLYLENAEPAYYQAVMRSLGRQLRHLSKHAHDAEDGLPRLNVYIALAYATLCISGLERLQARVGRLLGLELSRQVLPDGGHVSRHPGAILELLLDLLPLRQTYLSRDVAPPREVISSIDRMMPMVRFFRHGDGDFALFNGMGRTPVGAVSSVLAYDDTLGRHAEQAPHSGYQRLEGGRTLVLLDAGAPPPVAVSRSAHAGTLSFELSAGAQRVVTNCGTSPAYRDEWRRAARMTAAHSTLVVANTSSSRFVGASGGEHAADARMVPSTKAVQVRRERQGHGTTVEARFDGYKALGIIHTRKLSLSDDGLDLEGQDRLTRSSALFSRTRPYAIRFHLHPLVSAQIDRDGRTVVLSLPNGERWEFTTAAATPRLEESVFLADPKGARATTQIVVSGQCGNEAVVKWAFARDSGQNLRRVRAARAGEREEGILPAADDLLPEDEAQTRPEPDAPSEAPAGSGSDSRNAPAPEGRPDTPRAAPAGRPSTQTASPAAKARPAPQQGPPRPPAPKPDTGGASDAAPPADDAAGSADAEPDTGPPPADAGQDAPDKAPDATKPADAPSPAPARKSGLGLRSSLKSRTPSDASGERPKASLFGRTKPAESEPPRPLRGPAASPAKPTAPRPGPNIVRPPSGESADAAKKSGQDKLAPQTEPEPASDRELPPRKPLFARSTQRPKEAPKPAKGKGPPSNAGGFTSFRPGRERDPDDGKT